MPATEWGWLITPEELESWIIQRTPELVVLNKPPHVVCHPSRFGPWSSLIGATRTLLGVDRLHMPSRLDRETSGVLVFATDRETGRRLQNAVLHKRMSKTYLAIVEGEMAAPATVDQPIGRDEGSEFFSRQGVVDGGQPSITEFVPLESAGGCTLVRVYPRSGRRHQIRVHAAWLGHPIVGDKLYGRDPSMMLRLMQNGFLHEEFAAMPMPRQALHAAEVSYGEHRFEAPLFPDIVQFWQGLQLGR